MGRFWKETGWQDGGGLGVSVEAGLLLGAVSQHTVAPSEHKACQTSGQGQEQVTPTPASCPSLPGQRVASQGRTPPSTDRLHVRLVVPGFQLYTNAICLDLAFAFLLDITPTFLH